MPFWFRSNQAVAALRALTGIGATLALVQGLSFVANLMVVRALSVTDYAILTSSLSILGMLTALADSGLAATAMTVGGLHHDKESEQSQVLRRCRALILRTGLVASIVIVPLWYFMIQRLGGTPESTMLMGIVLFGGFFVSLGANIFKSFMLLQGRRVLLQQLEVAKTLVRVALLAVGVWFVPNASYVIACGVIAETGAWWLCRQSVRHLLIRCEAPSMSVTHEVSNMFWRVMPASIYRATSSQIFLLLLVAFGSAASVAGAGAIARFFQFYMVVSSLSASIFAPRLARTQGPSARLRKLVLYTACGWFAAAFVCGSVIVFSEPLLKLFGEPYAGLTRELQFFMFAGCLYSMNGVLSGLMSARSWVLPPTLVIAVDLVFTVLAITVCDVSTLWGFLSMTCIVHGANLLSSIFWACVCIATSRKEDTLS